MHSSPPGRGSRWHLTPSWCPSCSHELQASTSMTGGDLPPIAGDLTVCAYCARVLVFVAPPTPRAIYMALRPALELDHAQLDARASAAIDRARAIALRISRDGERASSETCSTARHTVAPADIASAGTSPGGRPDDN